jgi:hypothetical protein
MLANPAQGKRTLSVIAIGFLLALLLAAITPAALFAQQTSGGGTVPLPLATSMPIGIPTAPTAAPVRTAVPLPAVTGGSTVIPIVPSPTLPLVAITASPTPFPTVAATLAPTIAPTVAPTVAPTATRLPPTAGPTAAPTAEPTPEEVRGNGRWVANPSPIELWSSPEPNAVSLGRAGAWSYFELTGSGSDTRLYVYNPRMQEFAWIDANLVGPANPPPAGYGASPPLLRQVNLPGRTLGFNVRSWPRVASDTFVRQIPQNTPVFVSDAVRGDDGEVWYRIGDDEYVNASGVRLPKGPPQRFSGRWIDVDLEEPTLMTAYEDDRIVYTALALHGTVLDKTPTGTHRIVRRVENETMDSSTLGVPRDAPGGYYLRDVLYTQYFTGDGAAIHYNWWSSNFGYPGSHGCLGVNLEDARWFWEWASFGTVVNIH